MLMKLFFMEMYVSKYSKEAEIMDKSKIEARDDQMYYWRDSHQVSHKENEWENHELNDEDKNTHENTHVLSVKKTSMRNTTRQLLRLIRRKIISKNVKLLMFWVQI